MSIFQVRLLVYVVALSIAAVPAFAQSSTGTVTGRVIDPSGAAIAGAEVKLVNQATHDPAG